jgi:hypothetical protein
MTGLTTQTTGLTKNKEGKTMKPKNTKWLKRSIALILPVVMLMLSFGSATKVNAAATVATNAGTGSEVAGGTGTISWSNPTRIQDSTGGNYATAILTQTDKTSHYLQGSNYGFSIPVGATISGIQVTISRMSSSSGGNNSINDVEVKLVKNGLVQTVTNGNKAVSTDWPTTIGTASYGTTTDLWGNTWTSADINASNFGVVLSVYNQSTQSNRTASVDYMQITITYIQNYSPTVTTTSPATSITAISASTAGNVTSDGVVLHLVEQLESLRRVSLV